MILQISFYSAILLVATIVFSILAGYVWKRRSMPGGTYFALLMADGAGWVFTNAIENAVLEESIWVLFARLAFFCAMLLPPLWIMFVLDYTSAGHFAARSKRALAAVLMMITAILVGINEYSGVLWHNMVPVRSGAGNTLVYDHGIVTWTITLYTFSLVTLGVLLLFWQAFSGNKKNIPWIAMIMGGAIVVILFGAISRYTVIMTENPDFTPIAFAVMGVIFSWGVFRQRVFELMPVASQRLIENMADGVLVLNRQEEIVRINLTAQRMLGVSQAVVGKRADRGLAEWNRLAGCIDGRQGQPREITIDSGEEQRWIEVTTSSLRDEKARPLGTLLILRDITERKRSEETLRKSEYDLLKAERLANIGYFELDLEKREAHVSEGCARISGFPSGTGIIPYRQFIETIHPEDLALVGKAVASQVEQGKAQSIMYRILLPDGSVRYVYSESEMMAGNTTGAPPRIFGIVHDITEHKLSEEILRKSAADRVRAEQIAHLGYYDWDLKKREAQISEGCIRIFGFPAGTTVISYEMFIGTVHPDDAERIKRDISAYLKQGEAHSLEYRIVRPDGTVRHVHSESDGPVRDASGALVRQFGIIQDITERKQAEEALAMSEARYKTIVETANEGICIIDGDDRLVFINHKVTEMTGFTPEEALGHSAFEFVDSQYHDSLRKNLFSKRLGMREQFDYLLHCKDGGTVWVIASASPICDDRGEFMGTLAMLTNITGRKLADEQLKTSLKEKEALLKEVHHRVKNNLQIITSLLNLQSSGIEDRRYADMIRDSQNRIKSMALVHELLYKSKDLSNISISEYLQSLTSNVSRSYSQASGNVRLRTEIEDVSMDVDRAVPIGIIVTELVSNAYKYAFPDGRAGEILVELRRREGKIVLVISDNGVGLPAGFDILKTGTLGLQLVEMLAQQIDGVLEIEKGERTVFRISLAG